MMVPDYAMIGEIVLISAGFVEAKLLARIVGSSLQLSSEQLSSQDHYDFGMRALESILVRAGALRRLDGCSRSEMVLALSALNDVNLAKFNSNGFPPLSRHHRGPLSLRGAAPPLTTAGSSGSSGGSACGLLLQPKAEFVHKCIRLWEITGCVTASRWWARRSRLISWFG